jgi:hypothetical protein
MIPRVVCTLVLATACAAEDGITTTTTTEDGVTTTTTIRSSTSDEGLRLHGGAVAADQQRTKFDVFSGVRFGGIIGGSIVSSLRYDTHHAVEPEAQALVGVSGTKFTLGPRLSLHEDHWTLNAQGLTLTRDIETGFALRGVAAYRWNDHDRAPSIWHGIVGHDGWYFGGEVTVLTRGLAFDIDVTWRQDDPRKPQYTLAYGIDF